MPLIFNFKDKNEGD